MAVCRGKMSEGIDFADRHGRAVIVTGIPFPAAFDPRVVLKKSFMDELVPQARSEGREAVTGEQWYTQQAARAVNQAIGRVIRHRKDYGVILLCDERFANWTKQSLLSKWMKDKVQVIDQFGPIAGKISQFFQKHKAAEVASGEAERDANPARIGQVAIHHQSLPIMKARRQEDQKVATSFVYEQEYLSHKDQTREARDGAGVGQGSGLGSWMSQLDGEPLLQGTSSGGAAKPTSSRPTSLADQLMSLRAKTPSHSRPAADFSSLNMSCDGQKSNSAHAAGAAVTKAVPKASTPATVPRTTSRLSSATTGQTVADVQHTAPIAQAPAARSATVAHAVETGDNKSLASVQAVRGGDSKDAKPGADAFMASIKTLLSKDEYVRFKKAMAGLRVAADAAGREKIFDELHSVFGKTQTCDALKTLMTYLSRKLQDQMRAHLASKGAVI